MESIYHFVKEGECMMTCMLKRLTKKNGRAESAEKKPYQSGDAL